MNRPVSPFFPFVIGYTVGIVIMSLSENTWVEAAFAIGSYIFVWLLWKTLIVPMHYREP